jgi:allantoin racemase
VSLRLWYQSMTDIARYPQYRDSLETHAGSVLDSATEIDVYGVRPGTYGDLAPVEVLKYPYAYQVVLEQVLGNCIRAESQGYDAIVLGSYSEPFLREARCAVDIPVVSMAESTLLVSCSVSAKAGIVTLGDDIAWMAEQIVEKHHLTGRVAAIRALEPAVTEDQLIAAFADPALMLSAFSTAARLVIADHADVVIPAEGVLNELLFTNDVHDIDGVSVMDCVGVTLLFAEMMTNLRSRTGLKTGRRWEYPIAPTEVRELLRHHAAEQPLSASAFTGQFE